MDKAQNYPPSAVVEQVAFTDSTCCLELLSLYLMRKVVEMEVVVIQYLEEANMFTLFQWKLWWECLWRVAGRDKL